MPQIPFLLSVLAYVPDQGQIPGLHSPSAFSQVHAPLQILGFATRGAARRLGLILWEPRNSLVNVSKGFFLYGPWRHPWPFCVFNYSDSVPKQCWHRFIAQVWNAPWAHSWHLLCIEWGSQSLKLKTHSFFWCLQCKSLHQPARRAVVVNGFIISTT